MPMRIFTLTTFVGSAEEYFHPWWLTEWHGRVAARQAEMEYAVCCVVHDMRHVYTFEY